MDLLHWMHELLLRQRLMELLLLLLLLLIMKRKGRQARRRLKVQCRRRVRLQLLRRWDVSRRRNGIQRTKFRRGRRRHRVYGIAQYRGGRGK